jgi:hypothetical protein
VNRLLPTSVQAIERWYLQPSSPWAQFFKLTLLSSLDNEQTTAGLPDVSQLAVVAEARCAATHVAAAGLPPRTAWIVDLRGAASVAFAATLSQQAHEPVAAVATFNNWPADDELIPAEETLAALVSMAPRLADPSLSATPVFMLDSWRLAYRSERVSDDVVDNRYLLTSSDLPSAAQLRAQGISNVVYLVANLDDTAVEEDDLNFTMLEYAHDGIAITLLDLPSLCELDSRARLDGLLARRLEPRERVTLCSDVDFYARGRAGFGGFHAGPSPFSGGHWHGGGWSGGGGGG